MGVSIMPEEKKLYQIENIEKDSYYSGVEFILVANNKEEALKRIIEFLKSWEFKDMFKIRIPTLDDVTEYDIDYIFDLSFEE